MLDILFSLLPVNSNCPIVLEGWLGWDSLSFHVVGGQKQTPQDPPQDFESGNTWFGFRRVGDHLSLLSCVRILVNHTRAPYIYRYIYIIECHGWVLNTVYLYMSASSHFVFERNSNQGSSCVYQKRGRCNLTPDYMWNPCGISLPFDRIQCGIQSGIKLDVVFSPISVQLVKHMGAGNPPSPRAQQFSAYFSAEPQDTSADTIRSSLSSCADSGRVLDNPFLGGTDEHMALQLRVVGFTPEVGSNVLPITVGFQLQLWGSIILAAACRSV